MPVTCDILPACDMPEGHLRNHLCDLGRRSNGEYCKKCESQCAYGRRFINITGRKRVCQVLKDGELISEFATSREAANFVGGQISHVCEALRKGNRHKGFNFVWRYEFK